MAAEYQFSRTFEGSDAWRCMQAILAIDSYWFKQFHKMFETVKGDTNQ